MSWRAAVATFDAAAMSAIAYQATGGFFTGKPLDPVLWGSAGAAAIVALVIILQASPLAAWIGIGYLLYAALLATDRTLVILLALAVALMSVAPRPRGSLAMGILVATGAAFVARELVGLVTT